MRTTLTLEEDVAARLRDASRNSGLSFKDTVNDVLRRGLETPRASGSKRPFKVKSRPLGIYAGLDYDSVAGLLERVEGPLHR